MDGYWYSHTEYLRKMARSHRGVCCGLQTLARINLRLACDCGITAISKSILYVAKQPLSSLYQTGEQPPEHAVALCTHLPGWLPGQALAASYNQSLILQGSAQTAQLFCPQSRDRDRTDTEMKTDRLQSEQIKSAMWAGTWGHGGPGVWRGKCP